MTTPRPDETGASQNSSYRDTRSRSLQRMVRPRWLPCADALAQQMQMLEKTRRKGAFGIAVDRDREAVRWQKCHAEIFWLFRGLHWRGAVESDGSSHREEPPRETASSGGTTSGSVASENNS